MKDLAVPDLAEAKAAVSSGCLSVPAGRVVASEFRQLQPITWDHPHESVLHALVGMGVRTAGPGSGRSAPD